MCSRKLPRSSGLGFTPQHAAGKTSREQPILGLDLGTENVCYAEISCNGVYLKVRGRRRDCDCVPHALMRPDQLACLRPDGGADALDEQPFAQFDKVFFDLTGQAGHTDVSQPSLVAAELGVGSQNEGPSEITGPDVALPQSVLVETPPP
jgi:hypothetical protein